MITLLVSYLMLNLMLTAIVLSQKIAIKIYKEEYSDIPLVLILLVCLFIFLPILFYILIKRI